MEGRDDHGGAFARELRSLIAARGITLTSLHRRLADRGNRVSMATLSYWRSGARQPESAQSLSAVEDIEEIFGLDRGRLTGLIRPVRRVGRTPQPRPAFGTADIEQEIEETARALGTVSQAGVRDLSSTIVAHVDARGDLARIVTRALVQAIEGPLAEVPLYDVAPADVAETKTISEVIGGRVARRHRHPRGRIVCDVLALDDPVPAGGTGLIEYTESFPAGYPDRRSVWHAVDRPARQTLIWVHFHPDAVPDWCEEYTEVGEEEVVRSRSLGKGAVHVFRFGFGPGVLGVRWGFDADD